MRLPPAEFIPDLRIERAALALLAEHERVSAKPSALPIPIESIIERTLDLRIVCVDIEEPESETILARVDPGYPDGPAIQLNERRMEHFDRYFGTEAYSLAHEVGHWLLHLNRGRSEQLAMDSLFPGEPPPALLCRGMSSGDRREYQAERFGALLLLPEYLVRAEAEIRTLDRWDELARFAYSCGVSKRAMLRRLTELGLLLEEHGALVIPKSPSPPLL